MNIPFNVRETINKRVSVRNYSSQSLSEESLTNIKKITKELNNPFNVKVNYHFLDFNDTDHPQKLGTYGVIKGAKQYIGTTINLEPYALEALGYEMETLILHLTHLGLGTCWLGGTFNRKGFANGMNIDSHEIFPIITPVGYAESKRHMTEIAMRKLIKADQRKPWERLFFINDFSTPLASDKEDDYNFALEMVRLGPSASNKQPWRIVIINEVCHFFEHKDPGYSDIFPYDLQRIDMGIALSHFELAMKEKGVHGQLRINLNPNIELPSNIHYSFSWVRENI